jgi:hypothetical protein
MTYGSGPFVQPFDEFESSEAASCRRGRIGACAVQIPRAMNSAQWIYGVRLRRYSAALSTVYLAVPAGCISAMDGDSRTRAM